MNSNISTRQEATYRLVTEALGEYADEYDIDAIADEVIIFDEAYDEADNVYRLDRQGYRLAPAFDMDHDDYEGDDAFWDVVRKHEKANA